MEMPLRLMQPKKLNLGANHVKLQETLPVGDPVGPIGPLVPEKIPPSNSVPVPVQLLLVNRGHLRFGQNFDPEAFISGIHSGDLEQAVPKPINFRTLLSRFAERPDKILRNTSQYMVDSMDYFKECDVDMMGRTVQKYRPVSTIDLPDELRGVKLVGQELVLDQMRAIFQRFSQQTHPDRALVLHGPNASGKSLLLYTLMGMMEEYSKTQEGLRYTFSWILDEQEPIRPRMVIPGTPEWSSYYGPGAAQQGQDDLLTGQHQIVIPASLKTNPIFLLPKMARLELLETLLNNQLPKDHKSKDTSTRLRQVMTLVNQGALGENFNFNYFWNGNLDSTSQRIFQYLMKKYASKLSPEKAFQKIVNEHIRVEPWYMSKQLREGLSVIQSQTNPYSSLVAIVPRKIEPSKLPAELLAEGITVPEGAFTNANGGIVALDEMWKARDAGAFRHLLQTAETQEASIGDLNHSVEEKLDTLIISTGNDTDLRSISSPESGGNNDWLSLKDRFLFVPVPYVRRYKDIQEVFGSKAAELLGVQDSPGRKRLDPNVMDAFSLFVTLTHLLPINPDAEIYNQDKTFKDFIISSRYRTEKESLSDFLKSKSVSMLEKALLYQGEDPNSYQVNPQKRRYSPDEIQILSHYVGSLANEYNHSANFNTVYEGATGMTIRVAQNFLTEILSKPGSEPITVLDVLRYLARESAKKLAYQDSVEYQFIAKKMEEAKRPLLAPKEMLKEVEEHYRRKMQSDIYLALGIATDPALRIKMFRRYLEHMKAKVNNRLVDQAWRYPTTEGKPNDKLIREIEEQLLANLSQHKNSSESLRQDLLTRMTEVDFNSPEGFEVVLKQAFGSELQAMEIFEQNKNKEKIDNFKNDVERFWREPQAMKAEYTGEGVVLQVQKKQELGKRWSLLTTGLQNLVDQKGYPQEALKPLIEWAFSDQSVVEKSFSPVLVPSTPPKKDYSGERGTIDWRRMMMGGGG